MKPISRVLALISCLGVLSYLLAAATMREVDAQAFTSTPVSINLSTLIPATQTPPNLPTATWTPQATPAVQLQARDFANVRAEPDISAAQLGVIRSTERYPVTGRYFSWYQFLFPSSPTGRGWVFADLVEITGDASAIPEYDESALATLPPLIVNATETQSILTQTPGGLLTATAQARNTATPDTGELAPLLPTFTYPAGAAIAPPGTGDSAGGSTSTPSGEIQPDAEPQTSPGSSTFPPLLPIAMLGIAGLIGLVASAARR